MIDMKVLDEAAERLTKLLPPGARELQEEMQRNVKSLMLSSFEKMDLVTREEFEVQAGVLQRTRAKLTELEKRVEALENSDKSPT